MGNYLSCTLAGAAPPGAASVVRLVLPSGEVQRIPLGSSSFPATAAEVMLEHPGHFVSAAASVRVGGRFAALPADEDLEMGSIYIVVPMNRVGSVVTAADAGGLFLAVTSSRRSSGKAAAVASAAKVVPDASCQPVASASKEESLNARGEEEQDDKATDAAVEAAMSMARYRALSTCRSRKPMLETIAEETAR